MPDTAPQTRHESLPLDAIDGFAEATPSVKLRELIRDLGLLQPVVVAATRSGRYELVEGRRRCNAIAQLTAEGQWPAPPQVEALILDEPVRREVRGGLALALHASRSSSPASELRAIEEILQTAGTDREATTVKEIAAQTGMSVQTVRRRLRLCSLTPVRATHSTTEGSPRAPPRPPPGCPRRNRKSWLVQTLYGHPDERLARDRVKMSFAADHGHKQGQAVGAVGHNPATSA